jgi:hypothetical protein
MSRNILLPWVQGGFAGADITPSRNQMHFHRLTNCRGSLHGERKKLVIGDDLKSVSFMGFMVRLKRFELQGACGASHRECSVKRGHDSGSRAHPPLNDSCEHQVKRGTLPVAGQFGFGQGKRMTAQKAGGLDKGIPCRHMMVS